MANILTKSAVLTCDTTGVIASGKITIQAIVSLGAGAETWSLVSAGQTILNGTIAATPQIITFPLGLKLSDLNLVKSGTSDKIYIYTK